LKKNLIVIVGPTGIGKTDLSIDIAKSFDSEIISSDSRQIYREMAIGTAVPEQHHLDACKHNFIGTKSVSDYYNASMFEQEVLSFLEGYFVEHDYAVMVGGSMLYVDAVCKGIDYLPTVDPEIRAELMRRRDEEGIDALRAELRVVDREFYDQTDIKNPKRILKALEVFHMTGKPYSSFRTNTIKERPFNIIKIGLQRDREELYDRINRRVEIMMDDGLVDEAKSLLKFKDLNALNTVGYKEVFGYLQGEYPVEEAVRLIQRNTRHYAKKQMAWFKKDENTKWFHPDNTHDIISYIKDISTAG
jgi:tRNA dimethylallyltransferase